MHYLLLADHSGNKLLCNRIAIRTIGKPSTVVLKLNPIIHLRMGEPTNWLFEYCTMFCFVLPRGN